jgi:hypothetical protein
VADSGVIEVRLKELNQLFDSLDPSPFAEKDLDPKAERYKKNGKLLVSPVAHRASLERMGVPVGAAVNVGAFSMGQKKYLEFHQERVFLAAQVSRR